jgi:branched-subunit amino acid aminotransferase/4-amino-4-deoxychorismate lyase
VAYIYFKGEIIEESEARISIDDRSFRFGDGVFDTALVVNSKLYDFAAHQERLKRGLETFEIEIDIANLEEIARTLVEKNSIEEGYVRMIVSRGENGPEAMGYLPVNTQPYLVVQTAAVPFPSYKQLTLWVSSYEAHMPLPSKVNASLHYVLAMQEAAKQGCENALILNTKGHICETGSGNIFWIKDEVLYTPSLQLPFVAGTVRKRVIDLWGGAVEEGVFTLDALSEADEIFMSNIGHMVAAVKAIKPLGYAAKSDVLTQQIREKLIAEIQAQTSV